MSKRYVAITAGSTDEYLAQLDIKDAAALEQLRRTNRAGISPSRKVTRLVWRRSESLCFYSGSAIEAYANKLRGYRLGRGSVRFGPDQPIPTELIEKLMRARIERISPAEPPHDSRGR